MSLSSIVGKYDWQNETLPPLPPHPPLWDLTPPPLTKLLATPLHQWNSSDMSATETMDLINGEILRKAMLCNRRCGKGVIELRNPLLSYRRPMF